MYWILKIILTPAMHVCVRIKIEGRDRVPRRGPVILAANHRSFLDSIFIPTVVHRRVTFVAKADYFDNPKTAWFFRGVGQIPIRREGGSASAGALAAAEDVLRAGKVFGIYPEGTRTRDGFLHRGHTGAARLAMACDVPIVPVGLIGTDAVQPVESKVPNLFQHVTIRFGEPLDPARYESRTDDHMRLREITDEVMYDIAQLSGYEYVDTYATKHAEDIPTEPARVLAFADLAS